MSQSSFYPTAPPPIALEPPQRFQALISRISMFHSAPGEAQRDIAHRVTSRAWKKGAAFMKQGAPGTAMYILQSGTVKLTVLASNGKAIALSTRYPGESFGHTCLCGDPSQSYGAVAQERSKALVLSAEQLRAHLDQFPQTAALLLREISRELRERDELIARLALSSVNSRLARTLTSLARQDGDDALTIGHCPTHRELAEMIGVNRETVTRNLRKLSRRGLVTARGRALILSPALAHTEGGR